MAHMETIEGGNADCTSMNPHVPHDWVFNQTWGGIKNFKYRCKGLIRVTVERYEDDD